jgi:hypothetical protein
MRGGHRIQPLLGCGIADLGERPEGGRIDDLQVGCGLHPLTADQQAGGGAFG